MAVLCIGALITFYCHIKFEHRNQDVCELVVGVSGIYRGQEVAEDSAGQVQQRRGQLLEIAAGRTVYSRRLRL